MSIGTILLIILILALVGVLPTWGHSRSWGYGPSGGIGLIVIILIVLLLLGKLWAIIEKFVKRSLLDISTLDSRVQEEIAKYGTIKEFQVVLWRQEPDTTGCNWNARIEYIGRKRAADSRDLAWWDVVPQMRERFNLR
jgi:hypothetical protein